MPSVASQLTHVVLNTALTATMQRPPEAVLRAMANLTRLSAQLPGMPNLRCDVIDAGHWTVWDEASPITTCVAVADRSSAEPLWQRIEAEYLKACDGEKAGVMGGAYCEMPETLPWVATIVWPTSVRWMAQMSWITQYNLHRAWLLIEAHESQKPATDSTPQG